MTATTPTSPRDCPMTWQWFRDQSWNGHPDDPNVRSPDPEVAEAAAMCPKCGGLPEDHR